MKVCPFSAAHSFCTKEPEEMNSFNMMYLITREIFKKLLSNINFSISLLVTLWRNPLYQPREEIRNLKDPKQSKTTLREYKPEFKSYLINHSSFERITFGRESMCAAFADISPYKRYLQKKCRAYFRDQTVIISFSWINLLCNTKGHQMRTFLGL